MATHQDLEAGMAGSAEIDKAQASHSSFAIKVFKNLMKKVGSGVAGGLLAVVDQRLAGVTDRDQLALAFRNGFLVGFAFSFATGELAMALGYSGLFVGAGLAIQSFREGNFWQGIYRLTLVAVGGFGLYKSHLNSKVPENTNTAKNSESFTFKESGRKIDISRWHSSENGAWEPLKGGGGKGLGRVAPDQVEPGIRYLEGQYIRDGGNGTGRVEPWKAYYDEYGRLYARTDYNAADPSKGISATHHHLPIWTRGGKYGEKIHYEGEYKP